MRGLANFLALLPFRVVIFSIIAVMMVLGLILMAPFPSFWPELFNIGGDE